jgi:hypothetical protein
MASDANVRLVDVSARGDVPEIIRAVAAGANPNVNVGSSKRTPLQLAASGGYVDAIAALLRAGSFPNGCDAWGWTPLLCAACNGHTPAVDALAVAGADVHHALFDHKDSALHLAVRHGHLDTARVLLEAGAQTDARNEKGERPIDVVRAPLAISMRLRNCVTPLPCHAAMRRFALTPPTRPTRPPSARCWSDPRHSSRASLSRHHL